MAYGSDIYCDGCGFWLPLTQCVTECPECKTSKFLQDAPAHVPDLFAESEYRKGVVTT